MKRVKGDTDSLICSSTMKKHNYDRLPLDNRLQADLGYRTVNHFERYSSSPASDSRLTTQQEDLL